MIEKHNEGKKAFFTDSRYWDCSCSYDYIHVKKVERHCQRCGDCIDEMPASRVNEIHKQLGVKYPKKYLTTIS